MRRTPALNVLLVDGDAGWADALSDHLEREMLSVIVTSASEDALADARDLKPQLIILDLDMPGDGKLETCRRLRAVSDAYLIVLSVRCDESMTISGLAAGADDVLTKPVSSHAVAARIEAILRRHPSSFPVAARARAGNTSGKFVYGQLSIDVDRREVFVADELIRLTRTQFEILMTLAQRPGTVITRRELMDTVWGPHWSGSPNIVDVHIGQLRRRLGDDPVRPLRVVNVRGKGYRLAG
ncbi:response regulator transcription factor [Mycobacterium sp. GA-2829]|uniref:response regulator transcription factor n=1 Tax=Mycobacterium sp. GA-2829 TaxID=1772283 RepID=UPI0009EAD10C|nr:response regulator transcription factor [Mycobacterium sp. GA-2829]